MKYKVNFNGFAYVEADSESEALEKFNCDDTIYSEYESDYAEEVSECFVDLMGGLI